MFPPPSAEIIEDSHVFVTFSKIPSFTDKHCMVFDLSDEFTNIARPMVDNRNRPYARFGYGAGDRKSPERLAR
jgi:hypothetical protein